jgi:hypothetical protein
LIADILPRKANNTMTNAFSLNTKVVSVEQTTANARSRIRLNDCVIPVQPKKGLRKPAMSLRGGWHTPIMASGKLRRSLMLMFLASNLMGSAWAQQSSALVAAEKDGVASVSVTPSRPTQSSEDPVAAAKNAAQNPVANVISVPIQSNTGFGVGPYREASNQTLIEPVIPFRLNENWLLISRTIIPVVVRPQTSPTQDVKRGLGNMEPQFYLSPAHPGKIMWGVGPQLYLPTASDDALSVNASGVPIGRKWGGGVAAVGLTKRGHWLGGLLVYNQWAGVNHNHVNELQLNPFLYYNFQHGWYLVSSEIMTADWTAARNQRWTVPAGGGFGKVFKLGPQMLNARAQAWTVTERPNGGPSWVLQTQIQLVYPHKRE